MTRPDLLFLSLGTTRGLRAADESFIDMARAAGASVEVVGVRVGATRRLQRFYPAIDLVQAVAARRAATTALARHDPRAVVISTTTAALLAPLAGRPYAVRLDSPAILNRPGRRNAVQHALERRSLAAATRLLPMSRAADAALPAGSAPSVVVPLPITSSGPPEARDERLAVAYTPDPKAKGLDILGSAWEMADVRGARLQVFGIDPDRGRAFLTRFGIPEPPGLEWRGMVPASEFRAALRRARAHVTSARWEDFGQAQLEALADGALLVTTPAGGPYEALAIARELDSRLVAPEVGPAALAAAIRAGFAMSDEEAEGYRRAAARRLEPYQPAAVHDAVARRVLPALLG